VKNSPTAQTASLNLFWIGLTSDTTGTTLITDIAGGLDFNLHVITGMLAIVHMLSLRFVATLVSWADEPQTRSFHKFSRFVCWFGWCPISSA
jgi:uncharacterized repeat protein (TIGR03987 family)